MKALILSLALAISFVLPAQHQNIKLPNSGSPYSVDEPVIFINPKNTNEIMRIKHQQCVCFDDADSADSQCAGFAGIWGMGDPVTIIDTSPAIITFFSFVESARWPLIDRIVAQKLHRQRSELDRWQLYGTRWNKGAG